MIELTVNYLLLLFNMMIKKLKVFISSEKPIIWKRTFHQITELWVYLNMQSLPKIANIIIIGLSISCSSFIPVQDLSKEALEGIGKLQEIDYNFNAACQEDCTFTKVTQFKIEREDNCVCEVYLKADEQVHNLYSVLLNYWEGLYQLSALKLNQYSLDRPAATLSASNLIDFEEEQLLAFQRLAELSLKAVTGHYRKNRIKFYMKEADPYQQIISEKLIFILKENLLSMMEIQKEAWYSFYKALSFDPALNPIDKVLASKEYYRLLDDHKTRVNQIKLLSELIEFIAEEHHKLVSSNLKLNSANFKAEIGLVSTDLRTLHYAYEQLKK